MQRHPRLQRGLLALAVLGLATACLSPDPAPARRYFEPSPLAAGGGLEGYNPYVASSPGYLDETSMVWRVAPGELAFDEDRRWVVVPTRLVKQGLRSWGAVDKPNNDSLHVDVVAFEGVMGEPPVARLVLDVVDPGARRQHRFTVETPLERASAEELSRGMGAALADAMGQISAWLGDAPAP